MQFFTKKIQTKEGLKEFNFKKVFYDSTNLMYHVNVVIKPTENLQFRMRKDPSGLWVIAAQVLPEWLFDIEMELNDVIEEYGDAPEPLNQ